MTQPGGLYDDLFDSPSRDRGGRRASTGRQTSLYDDLFDDEPKRDTVTRAPAERPRRPEPRFAAESTAAPTRRPVVTEGEFAKGFRSGMAQGNVAGTGEFLEAIGAQKVGRALREMGTKSAKGAEPRVGSLKDIKSPDDVLAWGKWSLGQGLASTIPSLVGAAAGTAAAGPIGGVVGAFAPSYIQSVGELRENLRTDGVKGGKLNAYALVAGLPAAALDAITPVDVANRLLKREATNLIGRRAASAIARATVKDAFSEGVTEALQEGVGQATRTLATGKNKFDPMALLDAGAAGALTGGVMGGGGETVGVTREKLQQQAAARRATNTAAGIATSAPAATIVPEQPVRKPLPVVDPPATGASAPAITALQADEFRPSTRTPVPTTVTPPAGTLPGTLDDELAPVRTALSEPAPIETTPVTPPLPPRMLRPDGRLAPVEGEVVTARVGATVMRGTVELGRKGELRVRVTDSTLDNGGRTKVPKNSVALADHWNVEGDPRVAELADIERSQQERAFAEQQRQREQELVDETARVERTLANVSDADLFTEWAAAYDGKNSPKFRGAAPSAAVEAVIQAREDAIYERAGMPPEVPLWRRTENRDGAPVDEQAAVDVVLDDVLSGGGGTRFQKPRVQFALAKESGATDAELQQIVRSALKTLGNNDARVRTASGQTVSLGPLSVLDNDRGNTQKAKLIALRAEGSTDRMVSVETLATEARRLYNIPYPEGKGPTPTVPPVTAARSTTDQSNGLAPVRRSASEVARENYIRPLAEYTPVAYREMSAEAAIAFIEGGESGDPFLASVPELALGQGRNRGVLVEVDTQGLQGQIHTAKPAWAPAYDAGAFELLSRGNRPAQYAEAVRAVTVSRGVRPYFLRRMDLKLQQGWTKEVLADGSTVYRPPQASAPSEISNSEISNTGNPSAGDTNGPEVSRDDRSAGAGAVRGAETPTPDRTGPAEAAPARAERGVGGAPDATGRAGADAVRGSDAAGGSAAQSDDAVRGAGGSAAERDAAGRRDDPARLGASASDVEVYGSPDPSSLYDDLFDDSLDASLESSSDDAGDTVPMASPEAERGASPRDTADSLTSTPAGVLQQQIVSRPTDLRGRADAVGTVAGATIGGAFGGPFGALFGALTGYAAVRTAQRSALMVQRLRAESAPLRALIEINRTLAASVGVSLRQGRGNLAAMRALGWYRPTNDAIRVKRFGDVSTGAHEVGHYLSNRYLHTSPAARKAGTAITVPAAVRTELLAAGKALYGSRKPNGGYAEEGIAEFFKFYVTDPAKLVAEMPNARAFFDGLLLHEPTIRAALDHAQRDYARFVQAPAAAQIGAMLSVNEGRWGIPSFPVLWANLKRSWLDDLTDIREAVETLQETKPVTPSRNAYVLARLARGVAGEADQAIDSGIRLQDGRVLTDGIRDALRSIPDDRLDAFVEYVVAERAIEKTLQGVNTGINLTAAAAIQAQYANDPVFGPAAEALWAHSNALLALRVEAGILTPEQGAAVLERNQRRVPFQREFSDEEKARGVGSTGRAPVRNSSGIQRMIGSDRRIIDPLESILRETHDTYRQVRQHAAMQALVEHAQDAPSGAQFIEVLKEAPKDAVRIAGEEALGQVLDRLIDLGILDPSTTSGTIAGLSEDERDTLYAALVDFRERSQATGRERKDLVLPMLLDGRRQWVQVKDVALYEALLGMNREEQQGWMRLAAHASGLLRAGATLTTSFIARNPGRDALSAFVRTRGGWALPFEHLARGLFHLARRDELFEAWRRAGGDNVAQLSLDRAKNQDALAALRRTMGERVLVAITPGHWLDTLRAVSAVSENATRLGEFDLVLKKQRAEGASETDALTAAAMAARDVTVDFAKAGTAGRAFNQIVAFFNANVQDLANMAEDLNVRRDPKRAAEVIAKASLLAVPTLLLWMAQRDDDDYDEIPQEIRDRNYVYIHRAIGPDGTEDRLKSAVFTFPKSYGLAGLLSLLTERVAEYLHTHDPKSLDAIRETMTSSYVPSIIPTFAIPLFEVYANHDRFRDRPIVSQGLERLRPEDQATDRTGETARLLGQAVGYSPALLEHLIVGYTAGLGRSSLEAVDWLVRGARDRAGLEPLRPLLPMEQVGAFGAPVASAFWRPLPGGNAESVSRFYDEAEDAERSAASFARAKESNPERAAAMLAANGGAIAAATSEDGRRSVVRATRAELEKLSEQRRQVQRSSVPTEPKRQMLRQLDDQRIQAARVGRELLRAAKSQAQWAER